MCLCNCLSIFNKFDSKVFNINLVLVNIVRLIFNIYLFYSPHFIRVINNFLLDKHNDIYKHCLYYDWCVYTILCFFIMYIMLIYYVS